MSNRDSYNSYYNRRRRALKESRNEAQGVVVVDGGGREQATIDGSSTGLSRCPILHRSDGDLSACYGAHDPTC